MLLNTAILAPVCVGLANNSQLLRTEVRIDNHENFDIEHNSANYQGFSFGYIIDFNNKNISLIRHPLPRVQVK
jgi:hypothetical protein